MELHNDFSIFGRGSSADLSVTGLNGTSLFDKYDNRENDGNNDNCTTMVGRTGQRSPP